MIVNFPWALDNAPGGAGGWWSASSDPQGMPLVDGQGRRQPSRRRLDPRRDQGGAMSPGGLKD